MAANKFATMLHRKTNKITLILVYAMLEWVLIVLLLLNSLFSYLIIKFADYFGLKRPCLWCSRLDHYFEPAKFQNSYRSHVCEAHAMEISKLGFCSNHRKLAESQDMCEDCSSSPQQNSPINNIHKGNYILEAESDDKIDEEDHSDRKRSGFVCDRWGEEQGIDKNRGVEDRNCEEKTEENLSYFVSSFDCKEMVPDESCKTEILTEKGLESVEKDELNVSVNDPSCNQAVTVQKAGCKKDVSSEIQPQHLEFYIDQDDCHLIPIDLMDSSRMEKQISNRNEKREEENCGDEDFVLEFDKHVGTQYELVVEDRFI
ncbi:hypothetical protein GH714_006618 [Hevea brasiliensis]|uniref:Uncharacterized protein n=1 Tax=Hevea brasiliensis TaxID=3981 RepID=A0A6A6M411_HEVBR|nr:hypothetical protein GH714_006618 [Hevea brasiliensis]